MLSPGSATALVNEALGWLQTDVVQMLLAALQHAALHRADRQVPRVVATTLSSAIAAVLGYLEAHITARKVWMSLTTCNLLLIVAASSIN